MDRTTDAGSTRPARMSRLPLRAPSRAHRINFCRWNPDFACYHPLPWLTFDSSVPGNTREVQAVQVKVAARHGHLSDEEQSQITEKATKLLDFFDRLTFIEVTVDFQKQEKGVEVIATAEHNHKFIGHAQAPELLAATNAAIEKALHQVKRYKEKIQDKRGNGHPD